MRLPLRAAAVLLALVAPAGVVAQEFFLGNSVPLTNTRYVAQGGYPLLRSNGKDVFLFWQYGNVVRATRYVEGRNRIGVPVLQSAQSGGRFEVVWTGAHFLVVSGGAMRMRVLDANATPIGESRELAAYGDELAMGHDGRHVLLVYRTATQIRTMLLGATGAPEPETDRELAQLPNEATQCSVASNGSGFVVLVGSRDQTEIVWLDASGRTQSRRTLGTHRFSGQQKPRNAIATDGRDYFAVWSGGEQIDSTIVRAGGTVEPVYAIERLDRLVDWLSIARSGDRYTVACMTSAEVRVLHVHPQTYEIVRPRAHAAEARGRLSLVAFDERVLVAWMRDDRTWLGKIEVWDVLAGVSSDAAFYAPYQYPYGVASNPASTLVVWSEDGPMRAGIRHTDGRWIESEIAEGFYDFALAAGDGHDFLVVLTSMDRVTPAAIIQLSSDGRVLRRSAIAPQRRPLSVAWNGTHYGMLFLEQGRILGARMSRAGELLSEPAPLLEGIRDSAVIASDGNGFLVLSTVTRLICVNCFFSTTDLYATRLGADMQRLDATDRYLDDLHYTNGQLLFWNGSAYTAVYASGLYDYALFAREISPSGEWIGSPRQLHDAEPSTKPQSVVRIGDGFGLVWSSSSTTNVSFYRGATHITTQSRTGMTAYLMPLGDGRVAIVTSEERADAPHYTVERVVVQSIDTFPPEIPDAPMLQAEPMDRRIHLRWTPPPQTIDGYRIEYRIGDDAWKEIELRLDANATSLNVLPALVDQSYAFRIRAIASGGMSRYSAPVMVRSGRRRAVR